MRIVLDTNSLLVSIGRRSQFRPIFDLILSGKIKLLITNEILTEYEEVISRKTNESIANNIISFLTRSPDVEFIQPFFKWDLIHQDSDDN